MRLPRSNSYVSHLRQQKGMHRTDSQTCRRLEQRRLYHKIRCQTAEYRKKERQRYHASTIPDGRQPHLYILQYKGDFSGFFKVGRTGDYDKRLKNLNCGHLMHVKYVAQYPHLGHLELLIHDALAPYRALGGSREWFEVGVEHIDNTIRSMAGDFEATYFMTA